MHSPYRTIVSALAITALTGVLLVAGTGIIDLGNLFDYENQTVPDYIDKDNTGTNVIGDASATLGRVLFYDKKLSFNDTVSCSTCHQQAHAFSDPGPDEVSLGVNGLTARHSMRLINSRFSGEEKFFWDERAATLEELTTIPIRDHIEMGFSGDDPAFPNAPKFGDLIVKLESTPYYNALFTEAFGDADVTEDRIQQALAQFIRSIQSFDSKFDAGLAEVNGDINADFPNFSQQENDGKDLFLNASIFDANGDRIGGGLRCAECHHGAEFSILPHLTGHNGVITVANMPGAIDTSVRKAPTLRDIFSPEEAGVQTENGPFMHDGSLATFADVLTHYSDIDPNTNGLDFRLTRGKLTMSASERDALTAFVKTLSGKEVYTNNRWSDPFAADETLTLVDVLLGDVNLDEEVNFDDIPAFITVLIGGVFQIEADVNQDCVVDFDDIPAFIDLLIQQ